MGGDRLATRTHRVRQGPGVQRQRDLRERLQGPDTESERLLRRRWKAAMAFHHTTGLLLEGEHDPKAAIDLIGSMASSLRVTVNVDAFRLNGSATRNPLSFEGERTGKVEFVHASSETRRPLTGLDA